MPYKWPAINFFTYLFGLIEDFRWYMDWTNSCASMVIENPLERQH